MNLAKFVSWDTLITTACGLCFGLVVGGQQGFAWGCVAFSLAQYLCHGFIYMNRIDKNLQILILRTEVKKDLEAVTKRLEELRKEAEQHERGQ